MVRKLLSFPETSEENYAPNTLAFNLINEQVTVVVEEN
jgi:hypothetical protein